MPNTLFEYYQSKGQTLPKWQDRALIWENLGLGSKDEYTGTSGQNDRLLKALSTQEQGTQQPEGDLRQQAIEALRQEGYYSPDEAEIRDAMSVLSEQTPQTFDYGSITPPQGQAINKSNNYVNFGDYSIGPFDTPEEANSWGLANLPNDAFGVTPYSIASPQRGNISAITGISPESYTSQFSSQTQSTTGDPILDETIDSIKKLLDDLNRRGQIVNPYVELTPEKQLEFLTMARGEVAPYYETQLKLAKDSLYKDLGYSTEKVLQNEAELERQYGKGLRTLTGQFEDTGMLWSGQRQKSEQELAEEAQRQIAEGRGALSYGAEQQARQFSQLWGGNALTTPQIQQAPRALAGIAGFEKPTSTEGLYTLSPEVYDGLIGERQKEQELGARSLAGSMEEAFKIGELAKRYRTLEL